MFPFAVTQHNDMNVWFHNGKHNDDCQLEHTLWVCLKDLMFPLDALFLTHDMSFYITYR